MLDVNRVNCWIVIVSFTVASITPKHPPCGYYSSHDTKVSSPEQSIYCNPNYDLINSTKTSLDLTHSVVTSLTDRFSFEHLVLWVLVSTSGKVDSVFFFCFPCYGIVIIDFYIHSLTLH